MGNRGDVPGIVVHDDSHTVQAESVGLWHHAFSKPVGDVVGAQQASKNNGNVQGDDSECDRVPLLEYPLFKVEVSMFAPWKDAP
jgi:hypothetical protein